MSKNTYIVVANKFVDFTVNDRTITLDHLKALFALPDHLLPERARLVLGQGLSDIDCADIVDLVEASDNHRARWDIDTLKDYRARATADLSHKTQSCNTLIRPPEAMGDDSFHLDLCIDQNCELMGDHQSGQHIQGMVLVEAARQAFLAVTEKFFLKEANQKSYFVINEMTSNFQGFVFPLHAHMNYRIVSKDINERRQRFNVEIDLIQSGEVKTRTNFAFTVYPDKVIAEKEASLAMQAAAALVQETQPLSSIAA